MKAFGKKVGIILTLFTMAVSFSMSTSVFALDSPTNDSAYDQLKNDAMTNDTLKYVSQDKEGNLYFDMSKAKKDGQSSDIILQGKLFNEISNEYANALHEGGSQLTGIPIWGNWCGPGYGGGPTKDLLDAACKEHDLNYERYGYFDCYSDLRLIYRIERDYNRMGTYEKVMASAVKTYFIAQTNINGCAR